MLKQQTKLQLKIEETDLDFLQTEKAIKFIKDTFEKKLAGKLKLQRVTAPRFLIEGTGLQDDLAGTQVPVRFKIKKEPRSIEVVHSLAKWKRYTLAKHKIKSGTGIYTDMDAIRKDEDLDETHSIYVDQWDWEKAIYEKDRKISYLRMTVEKIFRAIKETEKDLCAKFSLQPRLPSSITFIHSEELEKMFPEHSAKEREDLIAKKHGAVFIIGIGYKLAGGEPHDIRAADYDDYSADYDDYSTETIKGFHGLNGDILVWDDIRQKSLELSSMGIRVDSKAMIRQLEISGQTEKKILPFHKGVIEGTIPPAIGGGIGQSRLCMFLLHKRHIGEVQSSVWPEDIIRDAQLKKIQLL